MIDRFYRAYNKLMIAIDLGFGTAALLAPERTLRLFGHEHPSPETAQLFRNTGTVWLTFFAAHVVAERRDEQRDWWALSWLRAIEVLHNTVWAYSPSVTRPGSRARLLLTSVVNLSLTLGFAAVARGRAAERRG